MSSQKFIARNRAPRVKLEYNAELYGASKTVQLPFVVGVMADLAGKRSEPLPPVDDLRFLDVSIDNLDERMAAIKPRVAFQVPNVLVGEGNLAVDLEFRRLDDFSPGVLVAKTVGLASLGEMRQRLSNLVMYLDGKAAAEMLLGQILRDPPRLARLAAEPPTELDDVLAASIQRDFKPQSERARDEIEAAIRSLAQRALAMERAQPDDPIDAINAIIANIDERLSAQLNLILHHPEFQALESAWRGLHFLVNNTETDEMLKIRVLCISRKDLHKTLKRYKGAGWDQSPMFKKLYEEEYGQLGGEPYGCVIGDYYFDHSPMDVELLGEMAKVCAAINAPFLAGAAPALFQMESWAELGNPRNLEQILKTPEYAAWRSLRESYETRYVGLTMPRFLARSPYTPSSVEEFAMTEDTAGGGSKCTWANAAYAMAVNITRAFKLYGWCARIRGIETGGAVEGLPTHTSVADDGSVDVNSPTEIAITDRREAELAKQGFMPLVHRKNSDLAIFFGAQSLHKPATYDDSEATANASLAARLPYVLTTSRFAHYLMCVSRDRIGSFQDRQDAQRYLQTWINDYVDSDLQHSSEESKARRPLAAAEVVVEASEDRPGGYLMKLFLRPHYQLEGIATSLRVTAYLPSAKAP